jgi:hypothetical protein
MDIHGLLGDEVLDVPSLVVNFSRSFPEEMPVGLQHLDSESCWCDPLIEIDGHGERSVVHRQVIWN